jgi:hypothetical protein
LRYDRFRVSWSMSKRANALFSKPPPRSTNRPLVGRPRQREPAARTSLRRRLLRRRHHPLGSSRSVDGGSWPDHPLTAVGLLGWPHIGSVVSKHVVSSGVVSGVRSRRVGWRGRSRAGERAELVRAAVGPVDPDRAGRDLAGPGPVEELEDALHRDHQRWATLPATRVSIIAVSVSFSRLVP